ncbi:hypothetical protein GF367_00215 [Candidatus Woesearchaeota archaeon]|nr:hypothetical protein [Candidatus Woesearchaeota archaeon]
MRWFLFWGGGLVIAMVVVVVLAGGLYPKHRLCEGFYDSPYPSSPPDSTITAVAPDWYIIADCQGVQNDLYMAYYFVALGAALIGVGFVVR